MSTLENPFEAPRSAPASSGDDPRFRAAVRILFWTLLIAPPLGYLWPLILVRFLPPIQIGYLAIGFNVLSLLERVLIIVACWMLSEAWAARGPRLALRILAIADLGLRLMVPALAFRGFDLLHGGLTALWLGLRVGLVIAACARLADARPELASGWSSPKTVVVTYVGAMIPIGLAQVLGSQHSLAAAGIGALLVVPWWLGVRMLARFL